MAFLNHCTAARDAFRACGVALALAALLSACAFDSEGQGRTVSEVKPVASRDDRSEIAPEGKPRVYISDGALDGLWVAGGLRAFLGIPFAKPPVGDLRWRPPEKNEPWNGSRDASQFSARCPQPPSSDPNNVASEDCLYLNIWAPTGAKNLPVMVWIHGGGNVNGSGSEWVYDGQHLASHDVIVVSINYRLGVFGFFAHEGLAAEGGSIGNQGLWDQQRALTWVHDNIEKFGGDPRNVTIFGESAGSVDVCMHVASPRSQGLFHRAVSQSGGCTSLRGTLAGAQRLAARFGEQLGCTGTDALACLRGKSLVELVDGAAAFGSSFNVAVDGMFMPEQPRMLFDRGEVARVPYMLGSTTDEGSYWTLEDTGITNDQQYLELLRKRYPEPVEPIAELYPASKFASFKNPYQAALSRIWGDSRLVCPTYDVAVRAFALGVPVYLYNWDIPVDDVIGAAHASELVFVFGTNLAFTPETMAVSEWMQRYWTNFAKTGDPNGENLLTWPKLSDPDADVRMNFGLTSTIIPDFRGPECAFWRARADAAFNAAP